MKILYLYVEVMGYTMSTMRELAAAGAELHVIHWDKGKLTPYQIPDQSNLYFYPRSSESYSSIKELAVRINPDLTVISGWMDSTYLKVARWIRGRGGVVVSGFDGEWNGSIGKRVAALLGKLRWFSRYYSHAWVSGPFQYEYARRLGFRKEEIIFDLYSADYSAFTKVYREALPVKKQYYPHRFLFVGRFEAVKGLDVLLEAWRLLGENRKDWELHLIGTGSLRHTLAGVSGVVVKDFMQPDELVREVVASGCFVLPSRSEPWGVVVHEFAAAGLPLVLSDVVGAAAAFLINGFNGYKFKTNNAHSLCRSLSKVIMTSDAKLVEMGIVSHMLSARITPATSAQNLLGIL